jgi:hypothetical protein
MFFGRRSRGDQAVHEMDLCFSIAIQSVQVNRRINFNTRAGNESAERGGDISTRVLVERLQTQTRTRREQLATPQLPRRRTL